MKQKTFHQGYVLKLTPLSVSRGISKTLHRRCNDGFSQYKDIRMLKLSTIFIILLFPPFVQAQVLAENVAPQVTIPGYTVQNPDSSQPKSQPDTVIQSAPQPMPIMQPNNTAPIQPQQNTMPVPNTAPQQNNLPQQNSMPVPNNTVPLQNGTSVPNNALQPAAALKQNSLPAQNIMAQQSTTSTSSPALPPIGDDNSLTSYTNLMACTPATVTKSNATAKILGWENDKCHIIVSSQSNADTFNAECRLSKSTIQNVYNALKQYNEAKTPANFQMLTQTMQTYMKECVVTVNGKTIAYPK
jgi:hypothetical protein